MSSECRCHTNEWCFYCEVYSPLERKHEEQRLTLVRVIADLEKKIQLSDKESREASERGSLYGEGLAMGRASGYDRVIHRLKEVLSLETGDTGNAAESQRNDQRE